MAEMKTKLTGASVDDFLNGVDDPTRREDSLVLAGLIREETGEEPRMWGPAIIGYGSTHLKYASGRELDWFPLGFSPRKKTLTLYLGFSVESFAPILSRLGKHSGNVGCLHIPRLADIDLDVLRELIRAVWKLSERK